jgi:hypothetical protein
MLHIFILVIINYQYLRMQNRFVAPQNFRPLAATVSKVSDIGYFISNIGWSVKKLVC